MTGKHVFLSYIREDSAAIDELESILTSAGFEVWRDTKDLWPGDNWELKIREAIQAGSLVFLACFSSSLAGREASYQYAELMLAADQYKLRPLDTNWLMIVRLDECAIPAVDLGGGRTLDHTINRVDLFGPQRTSQVARLISSIHRVIEATPGVPSAAVAESVANDKLAEGSGTSRIRELLRNPRLVMDYDEYMQGLRSSVLAQLRDRDRFPMQGQGGPLSKDQIREWVARMHDYELVIAPLLEQVKLIAGYGEESHAQGLASFMSAICQESVQHEGLNIKCAAHQYPAVVLTYVVALAAVAKANYRQFRAGIADAVVRDNSVRVPFIARSGSSAVASEWAAIATLLCREDDGEELTDDLIDGLLERRIAVRLTPISDHIFTLLAPLFRESFASDEDYAEAFDHAEILLDAIAEDARLSIDGFYGGGSYGRYTWRNRYAELAPEAKLKESVETAGAGWTPLLAGLFGGDSARATAALDVVVDNANYVRQRRY